jgi:hypothetical protein
MNYKAVAALYRSRYLRTFIFFFLLFALSTYRGVGGWGDASRMAQIQSIVEHGTFIIDDSVFLPQTGDKYFFNGHFYSDKPPILALYASPIYFVISRLGLTFQNYQGIACYLVTLLTIGTASALGLVFFRKILRQFLSASDAWADLITFIVGTGSLILPYSLVLNNHIPSGVLTLIGFYYILSSSLGKHNRSNAIYAGLCFSLAGTIDISFFIFLPFALILFCRKSVLDGLAFTGSCMPAIAVYLLLNLYTSGSFIPPAMNAALWEYPGSAFSQATLSGLAKHQNITDVLFYAFHMLVGNRGMISHAPILLLCIAGVWVGYKRKVCEAQYKTEYIYILIAVLLYIGMYIYRTTNYSGGGFGVRWFAPLIFFLALPLACFEDEFRQSRDFRRIFLGLSCVSIFISIVGSYHPFTPMVGTELEEYRHPTNTIFSAIDQSLSDFYDKGRFFRGFRLVMTCLIGYCLLQRLVANLTHRKLNKPKVNLAIHTRTRIAKLISR